VFAAVGFVFWNLLAIGGRGSLRQAFVRFNCTPADCLASWSASFLSGHWAAAETQYVIQTISMDEIELLAALDRYDALVARCARGEISLEEFVLAYDNFFARWALDGHESGPADIQVLQRHSGRIRLHREVWEEVLCRLTTEELARAPASRAAGFMGPQAAFERLCRLALSIQQT
jgi:hypothetical protein